MRTPGSRHGATGSTPRGYGLTPRGYGLTPRGYGLTPRGYGITPRGYGLHATQHERENKLDAHRNVIGAPRYPKRRHYRAHSKSERLRTAVSSRLAPRVAREQMIAAAMRMWEQSVIEE